MAVELRDAGIAVVSIWPPASKTEGVLAQPDVFGDLSQWRLPLLTGRVVAALASAEDALARSGQDEAGSPLGHQGPATILFATGPSVQSRLRACLQ